MASPPSRPLQNSVEFPRNPPSTVFAQCPSLPSRFPPHLLPFPLFRQLCCPSPLSLCPAALFLCQPPLLNPLFLHFLNSSANSTFSAASSPLSNSFSSIDSLLFEHNARNSFAEKHYDVPCPSKDVPCSSSTRSVHPLGQQRVAIKQKAEAAHSVGEKSAQRVGEQHGSREDKKRRRGGQQKVCFGLTTEEKAQIRATEANGELAEGFCCFRCGKVFSYEYYRDKHLKFTRCVDNGNRRFPCSLCSRSFEKRDRLRIHILHVHERYRPHECPLCSKAFSQSSSLSKHLRTHSGERPYQCPHCEKAFTASSILRTHIRQHSGEKPFKCAICGKCFASHAAHDSHIRRTHSE